MHGLLKLFSIKSVISKVCVSLGLKPLDLNRESARGAPKPQLSKRSKYPSGQYSEIELTNTTASHGHKDVELGYRVDVDEYILDDLEATKAHGY